MDESELLNWQKCKQQKKISTETNTFFLKNSVNLQISFVFVNYENNF